MCLDRHSSRASAFTYKPGPAQQQTEQHKHSAQHTVSAASCIRGLDSWHTRDVWLEGRCQLSRLLSTQAISDGAFCNHPSLSQSQPWVCPTAPTMPTTTPTTPPQQQTHTPSCAPCSSATRSGSTMTFSSRVSSSSGPPAGGSAALSASAGGSHCFARYGLRVHAVIRRAVILAAVA